MESQYVHLRGKTLAKTAWDALKEMHERNTPGSRVRLLRQIMVHKVDVNGDIEAHIKNTNELFQKFLALGDGKLTSNIFMNATLLGSLPDSYDTLITAMESRNEEELSTNYVQSTIIEEYRRRKERDSGTSKEGAALKVSTHNNVHRSQFSNAKQGNIKIKCYHCGGIGHFKRNCRQLHKSKDNKSNNNRQNANIIENKTECDDYLFLVGKSDGWILDSGAKCHICCNRDTFIDFDNSHEEKVSVANVDEVQVTGKGKIYVNFINNNGEATKVTIENVLYVPSIQSNLISVKRLTEKGFNVGFSGSRCEIRSPNRKHQIAVGDIKHNLYIMRTQNNKVNFIENKQKLCAHQWHRLLGHRDIEVVKNIPASGLVEGMSNAKCNPECKHECQVSVLKVNWRVYHSRESHIRKHMWTYANAYTCR